MTRASGAIDRRTFLGGSVGVGGLLLAGCGEDEAGPQDGGPADGGVGFDGGGSGGELLGRAPFVDDGVGELETLRNEGLDGRLYTDLAKLDPDALVIPNDRFYVRTRYPDLLDTSVPWRIRVRGLAAESELSLADLDPFVRPMGVHLLECSGNSRRAYFGLMSAAAWSGAPLTEVLESLSVQPEATRLVVSGFDGHSRPSANNHSTPGAAWVFSFDQLASTGAFLATAMNGVPLPPDHGHPVRLVVPGWYGCTCIKWVDELRLAGDDEPATSQMIEFASRTHQPGEPALARDYRPASIDQAAMPIRVEKWRIGGRITYLITGIMWGGYALTSALAIRIDDDPPVPVVVSPPQTTNATWTLWTQAWSPPRPGRYTIAMVIDDPAIPTRRLDSGYYERTVEVDEV